MKRQTRSVKVGGVPVGGGSAVSVQSMARSGADDIEGNLAEIRSAAASGCHIMRLAVPSAEAAKPFGKIAARSELPLVADTHFDWRTTLAAIREGAAKVRINPGNMAADGLARVVDAAGERGIPIRIGGNSGSILHNRKDETAASVDIARVMADEALLWARRMDEMGFRDTVVSVKSHDAAATLRANRIIAEQSDYPLHLGVTAAGGRETSLYKTCAAVGGLLLDGVGDTIRFSFTGDMPGEVDAGLSLLRSLGLLRDGVEIISCPTCGRCRVDLPSLVAEVKRSLTHIRAPLRVAVMGCEVNGPGEAKAADLGIASAGGTLYFFKAGEVVEKLPPEQAVPRLALEAAAIAESMKTRGETNRNA
jgi:(E)-4-hydroxy-3-methylbut-2-enyl-diphosphate synthase